MTPVTGLAALALAISGVAAQPPAEVFVGAPGAELGRTRVLVFERDGGFASVDSLPARRGRPGLDLRRGYQTYCGRWRAQAGGPLQVSDWMTESFSYPAPDDAGRRRDERFAVDGALGAREARLRSGAYVYVRPSTPPFDEGRMALFRAGCRTPESSRPSRP